MTNTVTYKQKAYEYIRRKLMQGAFQAGARLSNRALAREIGISFIPVREAISQLSSEGLVEHKPGLGTFVVMPSRQELEDLYDLREALECHAALKAAERMGPAEITEMKQWNQALLAVVAEVEKEPDATGWTDERVDRWLVADAGLHLAILRAGGNHRIIKLVSELRIMSRVFGQRMWLWSADELRLVSQEHQRIIEAFEAGDAAGARTILSKHIRRGAETVLAAHDKRSAEEAAGLGGMD